MKYKRHHFKNLPKLAYFPDLGDFHLKLSPDRDRETTGVTTFVGQQLGMRRTMTNTL